MVESQAHPDLLNQSLQFNKIPPDIRIHGKEALLESRITRGPDKEVGKVGGEPGRR